MPDDIPSYWSKFDSSYISQLCKKSPETVIDVGVGNGTWELYSAYPEAYFILVEPLNFQEAFQKINNQFNTFLIRKAVGSTKGVQKMRVSRQDPEKSSFKARKEIACNKAEIRVKQVPVTTINEIYSENSEKIEKPILLKLDIEGYELEAIKGANDVLERTETVIVESSIATRFFTDYTFEELITTMKEHRFYLFDILSLYNIKEKGRVGIKFLDAVFQKKDK